MTAPSIISTSDLGLIDISEVADLAKEAAVNVAREVARTNSAALEHLGQKIAADAVFHATRPLPDFVRSYVLPEYEPSPPAPKWVRDMITPFTNPILKGAKREALKVASRVSSPLILGFVGSVLTIFTLGYILGSRAQKGPRG